MPESQFSEGKIPMTSTDSDTDVAEFVSVNGTLIDLRDLSPGLRQQYHQASRAVGRSDRARDHLKAVGEKILAEQAPKLAAKAFTAAHKRSRVNGAAAIARLMGLPQSK